MLISAIKHQMKQIGKTGANLRLLLLSIKKMHFKNFCFRSFTLLMHSRYKIGRGTYFLFYKRIMKRDFVRIGTKLNKKLWWFYVGFSLKVTRNKLKSRSNYICTINFVFSINMSFKYVPKLFHQQPIIDCITLRITLNIYT